MDSSSGVASGLLHWIASPPRAILRRRLWRSSTKELFASRFASTNRLTENWPIRVTVEDGEFVVHDGQQSLCIAPQERVQLYKKGLAHRFNRLALEYVLNDVPVRSGDLVVDIGANIGEVGLMLAQRYGCRVIAIEPEVEEFRCLTRNLSSIKAHCINLPLWSSVTELQFYSKNDTGDSSLFEIENPTGVRVVRASTLKDVLDQSGAQRVRLVKLEAEGAEPEILDGADDWLERIDYLTADVGPERGMSQQYTAVPVIARMQAAGFELLQVSSPRLVCLFRNLRLSMAERSSGSG